MQNPSEVGPEKPYQPDSIDYQKVGERASQGYYREFWSAYKGRVRGMLAGVAVGGIVGAAVGLAVAAFLPAAVAGIALAAFAGVGGLMGADTYGAAGSAAASRAAGLAEKHARMIDPVHKGNELSALNDKLMMDGRGHNFQFPESRDKGKLFNWKSGALGAAIGAGVGALLSGTAFVAFLPFSTGAAGAALAAGALGLTFGIDRSNLKAIFNQVDANSIGKVYHGQGPDLGRQQFGVIENDKQLAEHRVRRQESTFALEEEYHTKIFARSVKGLFRGLAGGAAAGAAIGAIIGLVAFGVATGGAGFIPALAVVSGAGATALATGFAGAGALYGMKVFADAGREAGAESMARAIDNEFERNQQLREKGITPDPKPLEKEKYINGKAALLMGAIGVGVGALIAPLGIGAVNLALGVAGTHAAVAAVSTATLAAGGVVGGMFGAMYGVAGDSIKKLSKATDYLYEKSYVVHNDPAAKPYVATAAQTGHELPAEQCVNLQDSITKEDMSKMNERMAARPQKSFENSVLASQAQTATQTI